MFLWAHSAHRLNVTSTAAEGGRGEAERLIDCLGGSLLKKNTTTSMNGLLLPLSFNSNAQTDTIFNCPALVFLCAGMPCPRKTSDRAL